MERQAPTRATDVQETSIVFVVDDDDSMRRAISRLLRFAGLHSEASFTHGICPGCQEKALSETPAPSYRIPAG